MTIGGIKTEVNLNTIAIIVGFLATFAGLVSVWNGMQYQQADFQKWIVAHDALHVVISKDIKDLQENRKDLLELSFQVAQQQKAEDLMDARVSRVTESYGNQFTDIRTQLNANSTTLALMAQSLQRIEAQRFPNLATAPQELNKK